MVAARALAVALAAVVAAFFAIGIRQASGISAVQSLLSTGHGLTAGEQRSAASDISSAAFAYPGQEVQVLAAQVALREHRYARARSIAQSINRAEPDDLQGWVVLAATGIVLSDQRTAQRARQEEIRLDPIDAG